MTVNNSFISGNGANGVYGGGIYNSGTLTMTDGTLFENSASRGGGIYSDAGTVTVTNSTLSGNRAGWDQTCDGGAIYNNEGTLTVANSVLSGNRAYSGAGIYSVGMLTVADSTLSGNAAYAYGGGIRAGAPDAAVTITNTILAKNVAGDLLASADTLTGSHNLIGDGSDWPTFVNGTDGNLVGTSENPIDPLFIRTPSDGGDGWWDDYRTPDVDESANNDYGDLRLRSDSPAVDTGNNTLLPPDAHDLDADGDTTEPIPFDLAGNSRMNGASVDIGAYEYYALSGIPGDLNNDYTVDSGDLDLIRGNWNRDVFPGSLIDGDPSGDGYVGSADLDIVRGNWGAVLDAGTDDDPSECIVTTLSDTIDPTDGLLSLREALAEAYTTITFAPALYADGPATLALAGSELEIVDTDVSIEGPGAELLSIDGGGTTRVLSIGEEATVGLSGLTITGGSTVACGGGIHSSGVLTIIRCTISGNSTDGMSLHGGGVYSIGTLTVTDSTVSGNTVNGFRSYGGGIWSRGTLTVTDTTFSENLACYAGGAIWNSGTLTVNRSGFFGNVADAYIGGGGIYNSGTATIAYCVFSGNAASFHGGAIHNTEAMTVTNSILSGNSAHGCYGRGGGIFNVDTLTIANSTLAGNSADYEGGGIDNDGAAFLANTIVANNAAPSGPDVHQYAGPLTGFHNLIGNGSGQTAFVDGTDGNLIGTPGNLVDPLFLRNPSDGGDGWGDDPDTPDIDESANDDYGDLRLLPTSPAIDAGNNTLAVDADGNPLTVDLAGNPRIFGGTVDMGAYEALEFIPGDLNLDQAVDSADLDLIRANWGRTVSPGSLLDGDASGDGYVDSADLDILRANWLRGIIAAAKDAVFEGLSRS